MKESAPEACVHSTHAEERRAGRIWPGPIAKEGVPELRHPT